MILTTKDFIGGILQVNEETFWRAVAIIDPEAAKEHEAQSEAGLKRKMISDWRDLPIEELSLPARAENVLIYNKIDTIGKLLDLTDNQLLRIKNFGRKQLNWVHEALDEAARMWAVFAKPEIEQSTLAKSSRGGAA